MDIHLDLRKFSVDQLRTESGRRGASAHLSAILACRNTCIDKVVTSLLSVPNLFPYIYSIFSGSPTLYNKIMDAFPSEPTRLLESFARSLLTELSCLFFTFPSNSFATEGSRTIAKYKHYVANAWDVLSALICTDFTALRSQKSRHGKKRHPTVRLNEAPFHNVGIGIPSSASEAVKSSAELLRSLSRILSFYLGLLSEPALADKLKDAYFIWGHEGIKLTAVECSSEAYNEVVEELSPPPIHLKEQSLEGALQTSDVDGFGPWEIIISDSATKDLREARRSDAKNAEVIVSRIKQLSKGHFSGNNHKRLSGPSHDVPFYQAEVLGDLRIIYQIDCVPDDDTKGEHQVIKIHGICTHKELEHIWESLSTCLARGKEYQDRCTFRKRAPGTDVFVPASFLRKHSESVDPTPIMFGNGDFNKPYSRLLLDKYVKFSKAYLNGLIADEEVELPFQLTPDEWEIIRFPASSFVLGRGGSGKTTVILYKMLGVHRAWEQRPEFPKPRQVFVTKSRGLRANIEENFNNLLQSLALAGCTREELKKRRADCAGKQKTLTGSPLNLPDSRPGTPQRFSQLRDCDFPLFITFDCLAKMVAADLQDDNHYLRSLVDDNSFVTYEDFEKVYWPRLPKPTKGLAPWLVFSEFMGIIKGSEMALKCPGGILDEQSYTDLSTRAYPVFADQREVLYNIFDSYCRLKRGHDMADRTSAIVKALLSGVPLRGQRVDYMYVDEVQDNLIIDTLLLRILCGNPEGLFWAGDTAQTISAGCSFRFEDLKAFMYRTEEDPAVGIEKARMKPMTFQLTTNYRSHSGIVNCAQAVIDLIVRFWPHTIDILQPERSVIMGLEPICFSGEDASFSSEQFFAGLGENGVELGAQQCILVRDSVARDRVQVHVRDSALILTLQECKGLEFNDVFLVNFFEDSPVEYSEWRLILSACTDGAAPLSFTRDEGRYALLCTELKLLYVGITRARNNLYLLDKSEKSGPMRAFWSSRGLIRSPSSNTNTLDLATSSTPEQWAASGRKLFSSGRYKEAIHCFKRGNVPRELRIAQAFQLQKDAKCIFQPSEQHPAFIIAADAFKGCAEEAIKSERTDFYRNAAECYALGGKAKKAAEFYILSEEFGAAAEQYDRARQRNEIVPMFERHHMKILPDYGGILFDVCRQHYYSKNLRPPMRLFPTVKEELEYLEKEGFENARIDVLESHGRYVEAADIHFHLGRPVEAIQTYLKDQRDKAAFRHAVDITLDELWKKCSFTMSAQNAWKKKCTIDVLEIALHLPQHRLNASDGDQIHLFQALRKAAHDEIYQLGWSFLHRGDNSVALAAFDTVILQLPTLCSVSLPEMDQLLKQFGTYVDLVTSIISDDEPLATHQARRVFGITELPNHFYMVQPGSFLYDGSSSNHLLRVDLTIRLKEQLRTRLCQKVSEGTKFCSQNPQSSVFSCLPFLVDGICRDVRCKQGHLPKASENPGQYNTRISVHLRQICILRSMRTIYPRKVWNESMRDELVHLYSAVYPPIYFQGSIVELVWSTIEDVSSCIAIVQESVRDTLQYLQSSDDFWKYLMDVIRLTRLGLTFSGLPVILYSTSCITHKLFHRVPSLRPSLEDFYVVEGIVKVLDGYDDHCISSGVSALQYILHKGVRLDLSVLYDYLEEICSIIVLSLHPRLEGGSPSLHDLLLPRRWLSNPNKLVGNKDTTSINVFLDCVQHLMDRLCSGKEWFTLPHNKEPFVDITMAKLCRMLCIVGYNVRDAAISETIAKIVFLSSYEVNTVGNDNHFRKLEYLTTIRSFDEGVAFSDLVHLVHKDRPDVIGFLAPEIPSLIYENVDDIPRLVTQSQDISDLLAGRGPCIMELGYTGDGDKDYAEVLAEYPVETKGRLFSVPDHDWSVEALYVRRYDWSNPTENEVAAACRIQMAYRLYRIRSAPRYGWKTEIKQYFLECLREVLFWGWKRDSYRHIYLNKLPTLLVCLDHGMKVAYTMKSKVKVRLSKERGEKLEDTKRDLDRSLALIREGIRLRKALGPRAPMHEKRDLEDFRNIARKVMEFMQGLPNGGEDLGLTIYPLIANI
ncbi:hypothetical protein J3A83DRAFT_3504128 [Scleroderma citrinum]